MSSQPAHPDPKDGERRYYERIGAEGVAHTLAKPFGDEHSVQYLAALTAIFGIMEPPPRRVVEFGCGTGWLCFALAQRGYEVVGVDIAEDATRVARVEAERRGLARTNFVAADYEDFRPGEKFDYVIFHDALHHAESERLALKCAYDALRPDGCVIVQEPGSGHEQAESSIHAVEQFHVHEKSMPPAHVIRLARAIGFRRHLVLPMPHQLNRLVYRRGYHRAPSRGALLQLWALSLGRSLRTLLTWRRDPGLVLLWK